MSGAEHPLRELPVGCTRCGWSMNLKPSIDNPENYDITPLDRWDIAPGDAALCERCAAGWKPSAVAEVERLRSLLHDIAVARRGDSPDVDENWERLPQEIERMWDVS